MADLEAAPSVAAGVMPLAPLHSVAAAAQLSVHPLLVVVTSKAAHLVLATILAVSSEAAREVAPVDLVALAEATRVVDSAQRHLAVEASEVSVAEITSNRTMHFPEADFPALDKYFTDSVSRLLTAIYIFFEFCVQIETC